MNTEQTITITTKSGTPMTITRVACSQPATVTMTAGDLPIVDAPIGRPIGNLLGFCDRATGRKIRAELDSSELARYTEWINRHPEQTAAEKARYAVSRAFDAAEDLRDYPGEYFPALAAAEKLRDEWRADYPDAACAEHKALLVNRAADIRRKANDALHFSADGWLDAEARKANHDEMIEQAKALEQQAA